MNPFSLNTTESNSQSIPATNPSPFKLFKEHSIPTPTNKFQNPGPSASITPSSTLPTLGSAGIPNSFPSLSAPNAVFTQNPVLTHSTEPKTSAMAELEAKKNSLLYQKRVQDVLDEWKKSAEKDISTFNVLAKELKLSEHNVWEIQNKILTIHNSYMRIKKEKQIFDENLDFIESELDGMNSTVGFIEKEIENLFGKTGIYVVNRDAENIYSAANALRKGVDEMEKDLYYRMKDVNDRFEDEEPEYLEDIICNYFETLGWIEQTSVKIVGRMEKMKKYYEHLI